MYKDLIYRYKSSIKSMKARIQRAEKRLESEQALNRIQALECLIHNMEMMIDDLSYRINCFTGK